LKGPATEVAATNEGVWLRPFQENKPPKNDQFPEEKVSGLGDFNFWNYLTPEVFENLSGLGGDITRVTV